ncbi:l-serine dehydratase l-threonine deaminase [Moniliophthora roreri]|uniref:L-serine ammonia-lyase n=1 Tax=Moniliophthora roreri TaxID=221103 RepID=A0A0W0FUZ7_MONRR|nr:l-serine dehydratase l-threonine deaminase [Moniliophthora roreri]
MTSAPLWNKTPLIYSRHLSKITGCSVYLKLENLQPANSFKSRGIGHFVQVAKEKHGPDVHLIIASGGNAGYAAACAARTLQVKCTVYIPEWVAQRTLDLLRDQEAEVVIVGKVYLEALNAAKEAVTKESNAVMVPAYDDPLIWEGHSSMISEISAEVKKPDAIFCSVGGGGMLGGIIVGCKRVGWDDVPIVALGTLGSNCLHHSMLLNIAGSSQFATELPSNVTSVHDDTEDIQLAHFHSFSSRASGSLGASRPAARVVKMGLERQGGIKCVSVQDELSMQAGYLFAEDHKLLVELACSTTLVPAYRRELLDKLVPPKPDRTVVFIVCGGFKISLPELQEYKGLVEQSIANNPSGGWKAVIGDGECLNLNYNV